MRTALIIISLATCLPASAAMYKWVDEHGVTQYTDTPPPQAVNRGISEMNKAGKVVKKTDAALTPEQIKAQEEALVKEKELKKQLEERRRRDQALIGTYTSEAEIDLARDRNAQQIDSTVRLAEERIVAKKAREQDITSQIATYKTGDKSGAPRKPPKELIEQLEQTKKEQGAFSAAVLELQKQKELVVARFNEDKTRFREIKQGRADSAPLSAQSSKLDRSATPFAITDATRPLVKECLIQWTNGSSGSEKDYAASGELAKNGDKTELILDGRYEEKSGKFTHRRVVCPLAADGKVDPDGVEVKKALASLGARY